jgi:hypothetical protein
VLFAPSYEEANSLSRERTGHGISRQTYALGPKARLVNELAERDSRVIEVHPRGVVPRHARRDVEAAKTSWNGQAIRLSALAGPGIHLPELLDAAGGVPPRRPRRRRGGLERPSRRLRTGERLPPPGAATSARSVIWY